MKLGIFDSGIGGEAIAAALRVTFPRAEIITINDRKNIPYGNKTEQEVITLTDSAIQPLLRVSCDIIIIACNTATTLAIATLRARYPHQLFIGIEPMIKTASSLTKTGVIAVCATPATLKSKNYQKLVRRYAKHLAVIEPDCSDWAYMIENNQVNYHTIEQTITDICRQSADVIVLGCTHYHWIKDVIIGVANGRARVIEPSQAIGQRVKTLLKLG